MRRLAIILLNFTLLSQKYCSSEFKPYLKDPGKYYKVCQSVDL